MNLQKNRFDLFNLINAVRYNLELKLATELNSRCGETYKGKYDVALANPSKVTNKVLNRLCTSGTIFFHPDNEGEYESLKDFRESDDSINLSALFTSKKCPDHIASEKWEEYAAMLKDVFAVLRKHGIVPMQQMVADAQRSFGYGAPKINKKFGGGCDDDTDVNASVVDVLKKLLESLEPTLGVA